MNRTANKDSTVTALLMSLCLLVSCGYHLASRGQLPDGIQSIRLADFQNKSGVPGIEKELKLSLKSRLRERGRWKIVDGSTGGEAVLHGTVVKFETRPLAFSNRDLAVEYATALTVDLMLVRESDGKTIWHRKGVRREEPYALVPEVVVTSSPEFRQETLNARNLGNLTEASFAETQRRAAQARLLGRFADDVYRSLTSRF